MTTEGIATMSWWQLQKLLRQRLAWQWWHKQQAQQLHHTAESIRGDLLQQTFAFRRYLEISIQKNIEKERIKAGNIGIESSLVESSEIGRLQTKSTDSSSPNCEQHQQWLERLQTLYQSLENLSNELSPPFLADDLPLALNFAVQNRRYATPALRTDLVLPTDWSADLMQQGSPHKNQLVLSVLMELLTLLIEKRDTTKYLKIVLSRESVLHTIKITIEDSNAKALQAATEKLEIQYLKEIFHSLTTGELEVVCEKMSLVGYLRWQDT